MLPAPATCAVILGYGIPRDILTDGNYRKYLQEAYEMITATNTPNVVFCGGHTNIHHPEKSEAAEMQRLFEKIHDDAFAELQHEIDNLLEKEGYISLDFAMDLRHKLEQRQATHLATKFNYVCLDTAITSFDNIAGLGVCMIVKNFVQAIVFCEKSRRFKVKLLCKKLLQKNRDTNVIGIDFDASRTWRKDAKQIVDYFLTWAQCLIPEIGEWRNRRQRRHIERISQK